MATPDAPEGTRLPDTGADELLAAVKATIGVHHQIHPTYSRSRGQRGIEASCFGTVPYTDPRAPHTFVYMGVLLPHACIICGEMLSASINAWAQGGGGGVPVSCLCFENYENHCQQLLDPL